METWRPSRVLKFLLISTAITFIIFWLPAVRGLMDGPTYAWGNFFGFSGTGTSGDYWFPIVASGLAIGFLALGYRGARMPFAPLLLSWWGLLAFGAARAALVHPENFRFRGDTLGIDISLAWVGPILFGGVLMLALYWAIAQRPARPVEVSPWGRRNWVLAAIVVGLLPVQFILLRSGEPHGTTDQIGVILTLFQWALISAALYPWCPAEAAASRRAVTNRSTPVTSSRETPPHTSPPPPY